jgi:hypothetical protein
MAKGLMRINGDLRGRIGGKWIYKSFIPSSTPNKQFGLSFAILMTSLLKVDPKDGLRALIVMQRNCSPLTSRNLIPPLAMQLHQ